MIFNPRILSSAAVAAAAVAVTCAVSAAAYYYKSRNTDINEVMVFCKLQFNVYDCFDKLMSHIEAAKKTVDVCMPSIHNPAIQGRLVTLMKKNIQVRIIIDQSGYNESTDFLIKELIEAGAEVKCKVNHAYRMQHKFCLVDDKILMTGTLDWGDDRSADNWNYAYITNKPQLVQPVKKEFDQMWSEFYKMGSLETSSSSESSEKSTSIEKYSSSSEKTTSPESDTESSDNSDTAIIPDVDAGINLEPNTVQESSDS